MRKRLFVFLFTVLAVFAIALPALAQERGRKSSEQQPAVRPSVSQQPSRQPSRSYSRQAPRSRPQVSRRPAPRSYHRPYYRSYYYPSYRYGGYGYGYYRGGYGYYRSDLTGLKFHLELVPKNEQEMVKRGIVSIDGAEDKNIK